MSEQMTQALITFDENDVAYDSNGIVVAFSGGEQYVRKDIYDAYKKAVDARLNETTAYTEREIMQLMQAARRASESLTEQGE